MYCNQCGKELPENAKFCNKCGAEVPPLPKRVTVGENRDTAKSYIDMFKRKSRKTQITIMVGIILLFLIILYQAFFKPDLKGTYVASNGDFYLQSITFYKNGKCEMISGSTHYKGFYSRVGDTYEIVIDSNDGIRGFVDSTKISFEGEKDSKDSLIIVAVPTPGGYIAWLGQSSRFTRIQ